MADANTEEIANQIERQGDGGMWLFSALPSREGKPILHQVVIYSYKDDVDVIRALHCRN
jgi:hypothetical protein